MLKRFNKALKADFIKRIVALIFLFNVIFILLFIAMTYGIIKNNVSNDVNSIMLNSSESALHSAQQYFGSVCSAVRMLANDSKTAELMADPASENREAVIYDIKHLSAVTDEAAALWCVSSKDGTVFTENGMSEQIYLARYPWFSELNASADTPALYIKSGGYENFIDCDSQIVAVLPVVKDGEFVGFAGAELSAEAMSEAISGNIYYDKVYVSVLDENNKTICLPHNAGGLNELLADSGFSVEGLAGISASSGVITPFRSSGTTSYVMTGNILNGWKTVIILDGHVSDVNFVKMYTQQIVILACLFVLELIATLNVIRHEAKDIPEISSSIAEISAGNYNFRINSTSENEIGLIAKSVDNLAQALQDKIAVINDYASLDPTTGLENKYRMYEYMDDLIVSRDETRKRFALLFIDIDNFKWITETLGHRQGDEFLKIFGQRLKSAVPRVFRFSGDEFIVFAEFNDDYKVISDLVEQLRNEFIEPIRILNDNLYVQFSAGVSVFPDDDTNPDMLLRDANIAVSRAKEKGKGRMSYYNASFHRNLTNKAAISQKLNKALENNEMFLKFQPIITVSNGDIHGFEVLVRWESEELGSVPPFTFVQVAEETGAIVEIGMWIFETGCRYLKRMNELNPDIIMSINVSPVQLKKSDFIDKVRRTINIFGVNPANIQIEITETSLVEFKDGKNNTIQELADMGIAIALDDFGTGYSSFGYLKDMPIKTLKVDKSFVDEICSKHKDFQITGSIIDMVKHLGIKTVVEGVESIEQYNILSQMGCDYIQGFLMSKPLSENDAMEFVETYEELHKPNRRTLEESSRQLEKERLRSAADESEETDK